MRLEISNDFHGTSTTINIPVSGIVSRRTVKAWRAKLCGSEDCTCSGIDGQRGPLAIDTIDNRDGTATVRVLIRPVPMSGDDYRALRDRIGTQIAVATTLGIDPQTISRRERGELVVTREAEFALRYLARGKRSKSPGNHRRSYRDTSDHTLNDPPMVET